MKSKALGDDKKETTEMKEMETEAFGSKPDSDSRDGKGQVMNDESQVIDDGQLHSAPKRLRSSCPPVLAAEDKSNHLEPDHCS